MGLISRLLTLPLAPVGGVVWVAEHLEEEAQRVLAETEAQALRQQLQQLTDALDRGEIDEAEFERHEEELLRRISGQRQTIDRSVE